MSNRASLVPFVFSFDVSQTDVPVAPPDEVDNEDEGDGDEAAGIN